MSDSGSSWVDNVAADRPRNADAIAVAADSFEPPSIGPAWTRWTWRMWFGVLIAPAPIFVAIATLMLTPAQHHPPSEIQGLPIDMTPSASGIAWAAGFLFMMWAWVWAVAAVSVKTRSADPRVRKPRTRPWVERKQLIGAVWCFSLPLLLIGAIGTYVAATPGCGSPYRELVMPLPDSVEVVNESEHYSGISGPGMDRTLILASDELVGRQLFDVVVRQLESIGWAMTTRLKVDGTIGSSEIVDGWSVYVESRSDDRDDRLWVELNHDPASSAGCLRF